MAEKNEISERKKKDALTAHLGRAVADSAEPKGPCLTPEQLADLATDNYEKEERQAALDHLAGCRKCYDAWVQISLSLVAMESGVERRKRSLLSMKNMGYLGSALAVAASVVVFFQLSGNLQRVLQVQEEVVDRPQTVRPVPTKKKEMAERRRAEPVGKAESARVKTLAPAPSPSAGGLADEVTALAPARLQSQPMDAEADDVAVTRAWLGEVTAYCRERIYLSTPQRWGKLVTEGQALTDDPAGPVEQRAARASAVMSPTSDLAEIQRQCARVLPLVAE